MGIQFTPSAANSDGAAKQQAQAPQEETFDIVVQKKELNAALTGSKEVDDIVSALDVRDSEALVTFGAQAAEEISKVSDTILGSIDMDKINDSGMLLNTLAKVMEKFDVQEISAEEKKGIFAKMFGSVQKELDRILSKYHSMGEEVDKIYIQLKQYEDEISGSNKKLDSLFEANVGYYRQLVKYILAGEQAVGELDTHMEKMRADYEKSPDNMLQLDITSLEQARNILDQRVQDLRVAENVAMQSIPMIKSMQYGNLNLVRKINSAFIITLPVFKQALTQAVLLKRQKIQADAMQALDEKTNEMLLRNAQNTALQTKLTAQLASGSSVKIETLEQTWKTIMNGIDETRRIEQDAVRKREEDAKRLQQLKEDYCRYAAGQDVNSR